MNWRDWREDVCQQDDEPSTPSEPSAEVGASEAMAEGAKVHAAMEAAFRRRPDKTPKGSKVWTRFEREEIQKKIVREYRTPRTTPRPDLLPGITCYEDPAPPAVVLAIALGLQVGSKEPDGGESLAREAARLVLAGKATIGVLSHFLGFSRSVIAAAELRAFLKQIKEPTT